MQYLGAGTPYPPAAAGDMLHSTHSKANLDVKYNTHFILPHVFISGFHTGALPYNHDCCSWFWILFIVHIPIFPLVD